MIFKESFIILNFDRTLCSLVKHLQYVSFFLSQWDAKRCIPMIFLLFLATSGLKNCFLKVCLQYSKMVFSGICRKIFIHNRKRNRNMEVSFHFLIITSGWRKWFDFEIYNRNLGFSNKMRGQPTPHDQLFLSYRT